MVTRYHLSFLMSSVEILVNLQYNPHEVFSMKNRYYIEPKSPLILTAAAFLAISFALRLFWSIHWNTTDAFVFPSQVLLPLFSCVLFLVCLFCWGKRDESLRAAVFILSLRLRGFLRRCLPASVSPLTPHIAAVMT